MCMLVGLWLSEVEINEFRCLNARSMGVKVWPGTPAEWAVCSLDELGVQASSAVDHAGSLGLLLLAAGQRQCIIHVAFLVQHGLAVGGQRSQEGAMPLAPDTSLKAAFYLHHISLPAPRCLLSLFTRLCLSFRVFPLHLCLSLSLSLFVSVCPPLSLFSIALLSHFPCLSFPTPLPLSPHPPLVCLQARPSPLCIY